MIVNCSSNFYLCKLLFLLLFLTTITFGWENEVDIQPIDRADIDSRIHEAIETAGILIHDPILEHHLNQIAVHLTATLPGTAPPFRIRIIKSSELNAFSLSDGTIYISLGMFGIIDNDAQLAMLLSHEFSHINLDHHRLYRYELHKKAAGSLLWGGTTPYNLRTALSGFSIAQENAADSIGLAALINRGYNAWSGIKLLNTMYVWLKYKEKSYNPKTATHPSLSQRYKVNKDRLETLHYDSIRGIIDDSSYQASIKNQQQTIIDLLRQSNSINELYSMTNIKIHQNVATSAWHFLRGSLMELFHPVDSFTIAQSEMNTALKSTLRIQQGFVI